VNIGSLTGEHGGDLLAINAAKCGVATAPFIVE
jgi:hypothetical protein